MRGRDATHLQTRARRPHILSTRRALAATLSTLTSLDIFGPFLGRLEQKTILAAHRFAR